MSFFINTLIHFVIKANSVYSELHSPCHPSLKYFTVNALVPSLVRQNGGF